MSKAREWNVPLCTLISANNPVTSYGEVVHVIEYKAYEAAVKALKIAQKEISRLNMDAPLELTLKTGEVNLHLLDVLKELGEHE